MALVGSEILMLNMALVGSEVLLLNMAFVGSEVVKRNEHDLCDSEVLKL